MPQRLINGEVLRCIREKDGQTQVQLAASAQISRQYLCDIENGRRDAKPPVLRRLAEALNCPTSVLEQKRSARDVA